MEIYTMISNGKARLMKPVREVLTEPILKRKGLDTKYVAEILNEDKTIDRTFKRVSEAARVLKGNDKKLGYIYSMIALGKARLTYRAEEGEEEEKKEDYRELHKEKEEEVVDYRGLHKEEEGALDYRELYKEKEEEVKDLKFELLLANVREMIHTGVFSEVLENSRETDL